jgi:hypothetical protein
MSEKTPKEIAADKAAKRKARSKANAKNFKAIQEKTKTKVEKTKCVTSVDLNTLPKAVDKNDSRKN